MGVCDLNKFNIYIDVSMNLSHLFKKVPYIPCSPKLPIYFSPNKLGFFTCLPKSLECGQIYG